MLRRVHVRGYKSLRDVEVFFNHPLTVIMGANAAGKSNLFDVLALLSRMATKRTLREAFDGHRGADLEAFSFDEKGLAGLMDRKTAEFSIEVDFELSPSSIASVEQQVAKMREGLSQSENGNSQNGAIHTPSSPSPNDGESKRPPSIHERYLRYSVTVQIMTEQGYLRVVNERLAALNKTPDSTGRQVERQSRPPFFEVVANKSEERKLRLRMEGQAHPTDYDVGLDYTLLSSPLYPPHYPHVVAAREELSRWRFYYLDPLMMREQTPLRNVRALSSNGVDLAAFFNTMKVDKPRQFEALRRALHRLIPNLDAFDVERTSDGFLQVIVRESGVEYSSRVISEGTLRILALLAITSPLTPATLIGFEEPENGVHPHRLELIATLLKEATMRKDQTQILVNTHSPVFPKNFREDDIILCDREDGQTRFTPLSNGLWLEPPLMEEQLNAQDLVTTLPEQIERGDYGG